MRDGEENIKIAWCKVETESRQRSKKLEIGTTEQKHSHLGWVQHARCVDNNHVWTKPIFHADVDFSRIKAARWVTFKSFVFRLDVRLEELEGEQTEN